MTRSTQIIAHITTAHPFTDNRIQHKECVALAKAGLEVHLVAPADQNHITEGVAITALPHRTGRLRRIIYGQFDVWTALRRLKPGLVHVHDPELIPLAILWRFACRRPAIYDAHEDLVKQIASKTYLPSAIKWVAVGLAALLERAADRGLDGVVVATPAIGRKFRRAPVALVQNFPWLSAFPTPAPMSDATHAAVYVGAISQGRGLMEMIAAADSAGCELLLAGKLATSEDIAQMDATGPNIRHIGAISVEDIPALLASVRMGLAILHPLPNYLESQSTKIYEYMAAGRPFVASNFRSWRAQLEPFNCGLFVDPSKPEDISQAVRFLLTDVLIASEMGLRGRAAFEQNFVFEGQAQALVELTMSLLDRTLPSVLFMGFKPDTKDERT